MVRTIAMNLFASTTLGDIIIHDTRWDSCWRHGNRVTRDVPDPYNDSLGQEGTMIRIPYVLRLKFTTIINFLLSTRSDHHEERTPA